MLVDLFQVRWTPLSRQIFDPQSVRLASFLWVFIGTITLLFGEGRCRPVDKQEAQPVGLSVGDSIPGNITPGRGTGGANTRPRVACSPRIDAAGDSYRT